MAVFNPPLPLKSHILSYISNVLKNPQALDNVMDDFDDTVGKLEKMADTFSFCKSD